MRLLVALLAVCLAVLAPVHAQGSPAGTGDGLDRLQRVLGQPEAERIPVVRGLARDGGAAVTVALLEELQRAQEEAYRVALLDALGGAAREGVVGPIAQILESADSGVQERNAASRALAKQGAEGVARLRAVAIGSSVPLARSYAVNGLASARTDDAWRALAQIAQDGDAAMRSTAIRNLASAPDLPEVTAARIAVARGDDVMSAASAVRQLAERSHPDAAELTVALAQKAGDATARFAAADLLYAMAAVFGSRLYQPFLEIAGRPTDSTLTRALDEVLPKVAKDPAFIEFLRRGLGRIGESAQLRVALRALGEVPGAEVTAEIADFVRSRDPDVVFTALRVLAKRGDRTAVPELRKLLRAKDDPRRLEALQCLHDLLKGDAEWRAELVDMLRSTAKTKSPADRSLVISLLAELGAAEALSAVWQELDDKSWTVRAAAFDFCRLVRSKESVPKLIARIDEESGRLREDLLDTLQSLTALRFSDRRRWDEWWKEDGAAFELVPADAFAKRARPRSEGATTTSYYGIPLISDRVVFVVDVSGSMSAPIGTDQRRTRLDEAKRQLRRVVEGTPEHFRFNVVSFHTTIAAVFDEMLRVSPRNRAEALQRIDALSPMGSTNVHDAMKRAFEEEEVDTIYLLSDGAPTAGPITDPDALADEIARWNRARRLRIHCISIGTDSPMLKRIAAESGGEYVLTR
ncbi:MAG: HEAT repeat domain-containing protein [Planctomycetes bacterium]|nr:HEAT repeat domain-containing protein [Planctomycetota bacterium]